MVDKVWLAEYEKGVPATLQYPTVPMAQILIDTAAKYPDRKALIFGNVVEPLGGRLMDKAMTYGQLLTLVQRFAEALQKLGVKKGDRVAIHMPNCPQFVAAFYATHLCGAVVVPCNPTYVARELIHQLNDAGPKVIVTLSLTYPLVKEIRAQIPSLEHVIVANIKEYFPGTLKLLFTLAKEKKEGHRQDISGDANTSWFQDALKGASGQLQPVQVVPEDTAVLLYTGGTTGLSKAAQLTHRNLVANMIQVRSWMPELQTAKETVLTAIPLFHSFGLTVCMNLAVYLAATLVLIPNPRLMDHVLKSINQHKPTVFPGVPAMYVAIVNHPDAKKYEFRSIKACISGAAGLPPEVQESFEKLTGGKLVEGYGLSEASPVTHCNPINGKRKEGSWIGLPMPDTLAAIMDVETGDKQLGPSEIGELCIQGPQVMKGYWNMPTETANSLRDGWLHTGDIAQMDADGFFRIVDRKKDMILGTGGFNIYPREVEDVLFEHPKILEAAVVGMPIGQEKGERVKAFVVLKPGATATEEEIIEYCRQNLAPYKVPKVVSFRSELPKSMVGKILRRVLVEEDLKRGQG